MKRHVARFWATLVTLALLGVYAATHFKITTDVSELLPARSDKAVLDLVREVAESELGRTMVLTLRGPDTPTTLRATRALEAALRGEPEVHDALEGLQGGPASGSEEAIYALYHPRLLSFVAQTPEAAREKLSPGALSEAARALKQELAQPMSTLLGRIAPSDPLQVLPTLFRRLERAQGGSLRVEDGRFLTRDGRYGVLFLQTKAQGFDSRAQGPVLQGIDRAFARVNRAFGGQLELDESGVNRFAVRAEATISKDLERVSTLATLGLLLLMFWLFRSPRLLLVAALPLGAGTLTGIASCLAAFGSVHGVTLAFGASMLGVALDYVEHLYCHHAVAPHPEGPRATLVAIGPALITGAATTLVGFLALGGSGIRGLQEVALFSSTGLFAALLTTFTLLPSLLPKTLPAVAVRARLVAQLGRVFDALSRHRKRLWWLPAGALVVTALGLPRARLSDDPTLGQLDPELMAEDKRVRERVARYEQQRFVLALGADEEAALRVNDRVARALEQGASRRELVGYRNAATFLPSAALQKAVDRAARSALGDGAPLLRAFEAEGFRPEAFAPFVAMLRASPPDPLRFEALARSPLAALVGPFRLSLPEGVGFLSFLQDVREPNALKRRIAAIEGARFVDQQEQLASGHALYQERTRDLVLLGVLGVLGLLAARYRDLRRTLAAFLPSVLAAAFTVAVLALLGRPVDLIAMAALLMVISMGVDYGVFLVDASGDERERKIALLSVFLAATTTVLGFGLLALSAHPMLSVIGITATVGMLACLLLAPTTLVLLAAPPPEEV